MSRYDICPECGGKKRSVSKTCQKCRFRLNDRPPQKPDLGIHHELLTSTWLSEFRGLFWGEGSAMIVPNNASFSALLAINLRADDLDILQDVQARLGGFLIWACREGASTQVQWRVSALAHVKAICDLLLTDAILPAKKIGDVLQVLDFCAWRLPRLSRPLTKEERAEMRRRYIALRTSRIYDC